MFALLSLVVCLASNPTVCETVTPAYARADTGRSLTFHECLGHGGQAVAARWLRDHPGYEMRRLQCSLGSDAKRLQAAIESTDI